MSSIIYSPSIDIWCGLCSGCCVRISEFYYRASCHEMPKLPRAKWGLSRQVVFGDRSLGPEIVVLHDRWPLMTVISKTGFHYNTVCSETHFKCLELSLSVGILILVTTLHMCRITEDTCNMVYEGKWQSVYYLFSESFGVGVGVIWHVVAGPPLKDKYTTQPEQVSSRTLYDPGYHVLVYRASLVSALDCNYTPDWSKKKKKKKERKKRP